MPAGTTQPLYILPFDHRASFMSGLFGWPGALEPEQTAKISAAKRVIYEGFAAAVALGVDHAKAGILVDEHFGADILRDAKRDGIIICIARRHRQWVDIFERAKAAAPSSNTAAPGLVGAPQG